MNYKLLGGLVLIAIGIYLIFHGIDLLHPNIPHKDVWQKISDFFGNNPMWNPLVEFFGGTPIEEPPQPTHSPAVTFISVGGALSVIGALLVLCQPYFHGLGCVKAPGLRLSKMGVVSQRIQPPSSTTQSRELSRSLTHENKVDRALAFFSFKKSH